MTFLVDTNVLSESIKLKPNEYVIAWLNSHQQATFITPITVEEMRNGVLALPEGARKKKLGTFVDAVVEFHQQRIFDYDVESAEQCAVLHQQALKNGRTPMLGDLMIAAIAIVHDAIVVTRNVKDFDYLGVKVINPFEPQDD